MDITSISSLASSQTKLMLANVKAKASESAQSQSTANASTSAAPPAKPAADSAASSTAASASASTSTSTTTTTDDTTRTAELIAKLESGKSLTAAEAQYLDKVSPGTYERILRQRTETSDYTADLSNTASTADATAVHLNKLTDLLTETKSVANDSSLTDSQKIAMYQDITSRVNSVENITSMFNTGSTDSAASITAFQNLLSVSSNAMQQGIMLRYNPSLAAEMSAEETANTGTTAQSVAAASSSSSSSSSSAGSKTAANAAAAGTQTASGTQSGSAVSTVSSPKTVSEALAQIRTIISTETANAAQTGVKTAGLNLLV